MATPNRFFLNGFQKHNNKKAESRPSSGDARVKNAGPHHLRGFFGERVLPLGLIQLVLTLGDPPCQATTMVRFLIMDAPLAYNILLGRPSFNTVRAIPFAYHMVIKFPTTNGIGMVRGNQRIARECYSASMKQKAVGSIYMDDST